MLAWQDGGWESQEGNALIDEQPEFVVCSSASRWLQPLFNIIIVCLASEDEDVTLIIGVAMEQEDALLTCKV